MVGIYVGLNKPFKEFKYKVALVLIFPILPIIFDVIMPFYKMLSLCLPDALTNFMAQYEATRTLSETIFESFPQMCLQVYMVLWCQQYGCRFVNADSTALFQALVISVTSIAYRIFISFLEMVCVPDTFHIIITQDF